MKKYFWWAFIILSALMATWLLTTIWFPVINYEYEDPGLRHNHIIRMRQLALSKVPQDAVSFDSPNGNKIAYYNSYDGYGDLEKPATTFTILDVFNEGSSVNIPFYRKIDGNVGRFILYFEWLDNRYILVYGDKQLSIIDTEQKLQIYGNLVDDYVISKDRKKIAFVLPALPLYGTAQQFPSQINILEVATGKIISSPEFNTVNKPIAIGMNWSPDSQLIAIKTYPAMRGSFSTQANRLYFAKADGSHIEELLPLSGHYLYFDSLQWKNNDTIVVKGFIPGGQPEDRLYEYTYGSGKFVMLTADQDYKSHSLFSTILKNSQGQVANLYVYAPNQTSHIIGPNEASCDAPEGTTQYKGDYLLILDPLDNKGWRYSEFPLEFLVETLFVKEGLGVGALELKELGSNSQEFIFLKQLDKCRGMYVYVFAYDQKLGKLIRYTFLNKKGSFDIDTAYFTSDKKIVTKSDRIISNYFDDPSGKQLCSEWVLDQQNYQFKEQTCKTN